MSLIKIYQLVFYQPIFHFLLFLYNNFQDFGLAIFFLTLFFRLLFFPFDIYSRKMQKKFVEFQEEIKKIEKKYNGEEKLRKIISLQREKRINPFFSFFSFLIQFPILIALYHSFLSGIKENSVNPISLGLFDLSKPNFVVAFLVVAFQYLFSFKRKTPHSFFQGPIYFFLSLFTFFILLKLPSAIGVYLIFNFLFLFLLDKFFHV